MKRYSAYPECKPSGIDWLGDIPKHWEIKKLKYLFSLKMKKATTDNNPVALENIESWTGRYIATNSEFEGDGIAFSTGDILFGKLRPYLAKILMAEKSGEAIGDLFVLSHKKTMNPQYAAYVMRMEKFIDIVDGSTFGSKMPRVNWDFMGNLPFLVPSLSEQQAIAAFLDRETAKIDGVIGKREKLIELLQEKRSALISHTVAKGLDPEVKLKPSGIDWLGDIPEHWEIAKFKFLASSSGGGTPDTSNPEYWEGEIPWVSAKDMKIDKINDTEDHITELGLKESSARMIPPNQVLLVTRSGILKHTIPVAINQVPVAINQDMKALTPKPFLLAEYLFYLIKGNQQALLALWRKQGCTVESIEYEYFANSEIPLPPLAEQKTIVDYLNKEKEKLDKLVAKEIKIIEKVKEYRLSLIEKVVTGKVNIRENVS